MKISKNHATGHLLVGWLSLVVPGKAAQIKQKETVTIVFVKKNQ
jgi:hypothetical protein